MRNWTQTLLLCVGLLIATITASQAADWTIIDLGGLGGSTDSTPLGINAFGAIVGSSGTMFRQSAVKFDNGAVQNLTNPSSDVIDLAYDINDAGDIVGVSSNRAFVYRNGVLTSLGTLGGSSSVAEAINNSGVIVGSSSIPGGGIAAFVYQDGVMTNIGGLWAADVNNHGHVVGRANASAGFVYRDGAMHELEGGLAYAINDHGSIVGHGVGSTFADLFPTYYDGNAWQSMGTLGGEQGIAHAINNREQAVGWSEIDDTGRPNAFLYSNGVLHNLQSFIGPDSGWEFLGAAYDINDRGQIVGSGRKDNQWRAFLMTPNIATFDLEVTYSNPLVSVGDGEAPAAEVTARFVLEGIGGMPGTFRLEDVVSAYVEFADGIWTELDLASFQMTLGPGGVDDILTLNYNFNPLVTPSGAELSLRNNSFQLYIDGVLPDSGGAFSYFYPDSEQTLTVVPEPSTIVLAGLSLAAVFWCRRSRRK